ncbi:hypothetical protein LLB_1966 [Legionella longbeachae D-4968]|nr:hypothetical protein LLB_1966 [Legionella longbeachae D-4968]
MALLLPFTLIVASLRLLIVNLKHLLFPQRMPHKKMEFKNHLVLT